MCRTVTSKHRVRLTITSWMTQGMMLIYWYAKCGTIASSYLHRNVPRPAQRNKFMLDFAVQAEDDCVKCVSECKVTCKKARAVWSSTLCCDYTGFIWMGKGKRMQSAEIDQVEIEADHQDTSNRSVVFLSWFYCYSNQDNRVKTTNVFSSVLCTGNLVL